MPQIIQWPLLDVQAIHSDLSLAGIHLASQQMGQAGFS